MHATNQGSPSSGTHHTHSEHTFYRHTYRQFTHAHTHTFIYKDRSHTHTHKYLKHTNTYTCTCTHTHTHMYYTHTHFTHTLMHFTLTRTHRYIHSLDLPEPKIFQEAGTNTQEEHFLPPICKSGAKKSSVSMDPITPTDRWDQIVLKFPHIMGWRDSPRESPRRLSESRCVSMYVCVHVSV